MVTLSSTGKHAMIVAMAATAAAGITTLFCVSASTPPPDADSTASPIQPSQSDWTPERMRNAEPAPMPQPDADETPTSAGPSNSSATSSGPTVPR